MPLARIGSTLLFFAHIPKTGGTSIEAYLRAKGVVALHFNKSGAWAQCSPQHMHAEIYDALLPGALYDHGFTILRDPVERLKSEYRYRVGHARDRGKDIAPFDAWVPRVFKRYAKTGFVFDNHIRPQAQFVSPGLKLFRLEDGLDQVFDWIDTVTGDTTPAPRLWKKSRGGTPVGMSAETEALIRDFYAEDYRLLSENRA